MYEIGQPIVCVKTHSQGVVEEGKIYRTEGFNVDCCSGELVIDVGIRYKNKTTTDGDIAIIGKQYKCSRCFKLFAYDGIWWISPSLFRPLDDLYNTEIEELMNEVNERQPFE